MTDLRQQALDVQCPTCRQPPGDRCVSLTVASPDSRPHSARVRSAVAAEARAKNRREHAGLRPARKGQA